MLRSPPTHETPASPPCASIRSLRLGQAKIGPNKDVPQDDPPGLGKANEVNLSTQYDFLKMRQQDVSTCQSQHDAVSDSSRKHGVAMNTNKNIRTRSSRLGQAKIGPNNDVPQNDPPGLRKSSEVEFTTQYDFLKIRRKGDSTCQSQHDAVSDSSREHGVPINTNENIRTKCLCDYFDGKSEIMLWDINSNRLTRKNYHSCGPDSIFATFYHTILRDFPDRFRENVGAVLKIMLDRSVSWNAYHTELEQFIMIAESLNDVQKKLQDIRLLLAESREPFWNHLVQYMGTAFSPKGTIDAYVDSFSNYLMDTDAERKIFGTNMEYSCDECDDIKSWCLSKITVSVSNSITLSDSIMAALFQETHICCEREMTLKETKLPEILLLSFEETETTCETIPQYFELFGTQYQIVGAVRHQYNHFISLIKAQCGKWCVLDDMKNQIDHYGSLDACLFSFRQCRGSRNGLQLVIATKRGWKEKIGEQGVNPCMSQHGASPDFSTPRTILMQPAKSSSTAEIHELNGIEVSSNHDQRKKRKLSIEEKKRADAERKKHARALESDEKRSLRLSRNKERNRLARSKENANEKSERLQKVKTHMSVLRSDESPEKKSERLQKDKTQKSVLRSDESAEKKDSRLRNIKTQMQTLRKAETLENKRKRLDENNSRKKLSKEKETDAIKSMRQSKEYEAIKTTRRKKTLETLVGFTPEDFQHCKSCSKILLFESGTTIKSVNSIAEYLSVSELDRVCYSCAGAINKNSLPKLSEANGLSISPIPAIIKKLNILERRHICQVQSYLTLLKLPGGQYAQKGMAIHFPADPTEHIISLPHESSKSGIVCVSGETLRFLRRELILAALHWLKRNNILYKDIVIAYDRLGVDEQELENLKETIEQSGIIPMDYDHPKIPVEQFLKKKPGSSVQFARSSGKPVSVLDKKHSDALAFPWLFPTGEGDFHTPRQIKLDYLSYVQSRILHKDPRFRADISFLIVSTNRYETMVLSRQVNFYMRIRKPEKIGEGVNPSPISLNDIQNLNRNPDIASNSTMFMKKTRGTPAYWKDKLWDLLAKMKMLGPPDLFLTLSCDDLGWEDLQMFLKADLKNDYRNPAQAVRSDPVAVAFFCQRKMKNMIQLLMKQPEILGKISDFHVRVEFQNRGSVHFHIFLWVPEAPGLHKGSTASKMEKYIDSIISTRVPDSDADIDLSALVKKLQTHHHTETCKLRNDQCRFHMPRRACSKTTVHFSDAREQSLSNFYETERGEDDSFINAYNPTILSLWKANMDLQIVNGEKGLAFYVCKYVLKSEPHELRSKLTEALNDMDYAHELDQKGRMMMLGMVTLKTRRMSAQEAAYRACGIEMIFSNRQVIKIGTLPPSRRMRRLNINKYQDKISNSSINTEESAEDCFDDSLLEVYRKRPETFKHLTYYQLASWYNKVKGEPQDELRLLDDSASLKKRTKALCVRGSFVNAASDDYYYSLLLQHLPHREEKELLEGFDSAEESFLSKKDLLDQGALKSETISSELMGIVQRLRTGMELLERIQELDEGELADDFAAVPEHDFHIPDVVNHEPGSWIACDEDNWQNMNVATMSPEEFREKLKSLSNDQALVLKYLHMKLNDKGQNQIQLFITGNAGTGKSLLLEVIIEWFRLTQARQSGEDPVMIGAPTGLAAKNVGGKTLHSLLKLPIQHDGIQLESLPLQQKTLNKLKSDLRGKKFLIVDEISMLGEKMLIFVNERLQQIFDTDDPFGGIHVIFCGDFFQLPPVKDRFCFGHQLFDEFDVLMLRKNMRQKEDKAWCTILDKIRIGKPLEREERMSLTKRVSIPETLRDQPVDIRLFPTNKEIDEENSYELTKLGADPVVSVAENVYSSNDISGGCLAEIDDLPTRVRDSGGLWNELCLAVGARVMTIKNLGDGIVNGSLGTIHSFEHFANGHVKAAFVKFMDPNSGRPFQDPNRDNAVRIDRYSQEYHYKGRRLTRSQLPLIPAWAITIHKAQGLSVNTAVVSIGKTIFSHGQIYVALSRVRTLEGLHINDSLKFSKWWQPNKKVLEFYMNTLAREIDTKEKLKSYSMGKIF